MLDGRVKTLHPKVHGGILTFVTMPTTRPQWRSTILAIDMVVVNLYAFEKTAARPGVSFHELIENIDIGGPSMLRSAAKNFEDVAIVTSPGITTALLKSWRHGGLSRETKWKLAKKAFAITAAYDSAIARRWNPAAPQTVDRTNGFPATLRLRYAYAPLRYGENPHQNAAVYSDGTGLGIATATSGQRAFLQQSGRSGCGLGTGAGVRRAAVAIIKHTNPCGAATGATLLELITRRWRPIRCRRLAA